MVVVYGVESIESIKLFRKLMVFLGLIPEICVVENEVVIIKTKLFKLYASFWSCLMVSGCLFCYWLRNNDSFSGWQTTSAIFMDFCCEFFSLSVCLTSILQASLWKRQNFFQLYNLMKDLDKDFNSSCKVENCWWKSLHFKTIFYWTLFGLYIILEVLKWKLYISQIEDVNYNLYYLVWYIYMFFELNFVLFIVFHATLIRAKYQQLKQALLTSSSEIQFRQISNSFFTINQVISSFNHIVELPLLFYFLQIICTWMLHLIGILEGFFTHKFQYVTVDVFILSLLHLFIHSIALIYLIFSCDRCTREGQKLIPLCYHLQQKYYKKIAIRKQLFLMANQIKHQQVRFNCLNMFQINRRTVLSLFSIVSSNLIVISQFQVA